MMNADNLSSSDIIAAKRACRKEARDRLKETSPEYRASASDAICSALLATEEYAAAKTVMAYSSVGREVSTDALLGHIISDGKKLCLPRCIDVAPDGKWEKAGAGIMEARYVSDPALMAEGAYGIREPGEEKVTGPDGAETELFPLADPADIDLIILPCIACDANCSRIGHGAGYYDRFLSTAKETCARIALCYDRLILEKVPVEEHDMPVNAVVSEKAIYRWRG